MIRQKDKSGHKREGEHDAPVTQKHKKKKSIDFLESGSAVFLLLSVGCVAYIVVNYVLSDYEKEEIFLNTGIEISQDDRIAKGKALPEMKPFHFYEERFERRDIFEMPEKKSKIDSNILKNVEMVKCK